jgi:hypothetical protein
MPLSKIKTNSVAAANITPALISSLTGLSVANTAIVGRVPAATAPAGSVIQVVNSSYSTPVGIGSGDWINTMPSLSITPKLATSKILVTVVIGGLQCYNSGMGVTFRVLRDGTAYFGNHGVYYGYPTAMYIPGPTLSVLDSPATTSAVTYLPQHFRSLGSGSGVVQGDASYSYITLMEIAQ